MLSNLRKKLLEYPFYRRILVRIISWMKFFPLYIKSLIKFVSDAFKYKKYQKNNLPLKIRNLHVCLYDFLDQAGKAKGHYFHQDILVARKIYERNPENHYDIGSRIDGFIGHLLVFRKVIVVDIRRLESEVNNLSFIQDDATTLIQIPDHSIDSVSALHSVEHFGLGRYGDKIDPSADIQAMQTLTRILKPGGRLYFSVPIGRSRMEFNAHRIYDPVFIPEVFNKLTLISFSYVNDNGDLIENCNPSEVKNINYGCGIYEFTR